MCLEPEGVERCALFVFDTSKLFCCLGSSVRGNSPQLDLMEKAFDKLYGKLKHEAIKIKRQAKAVAELETPFERNLREATSNKRWGCPNSVLHELAVDAQTYKCRQKIMSRSLENLNGNQDKWRRILKTLILLEYLVKNGGENIADELRGEQLTFRRLANYQCKDEGHDRGSGVREKADALVKLLNDKDLLRQEREQAKLHHTKLTGGGPTAIVGGSRGSASPSMPSSSVSSVLGDALNELRPGADSRTLSASQAAELERRFNRLREEQLAERAARESKMEGRAPSREASERVDAEDERPREDRFGLFDPSFAPQDGKDDSDSDRSPSRPSNAQAMPAVDLLDMDADDDARPAVSMPVQHAAAESEEWGSFCSPSVAQTVQTGFGEDAPAKSEAVDITAFMDFTSSSTTPSAPSAPPSFASFTQAGSASDPFTGMEVKPAVASFPQSDGWPTSGQSLVGGGYADGETGVPVFKGEGTGQAPLSGTFLDGMGVPVNMLDFNHSSVQQDLPSKSVRDAKPADPLAALDVLRVGSQP